MLQIRLKYRTYDFWTSIIKLPLINLKKIIPGFHHKFRQLWWTVYEQQRVDSPYYYTRKFIVKNGYLLYRNTAVKLYHFRLLDIFLLPFDQGITVNDDPYRNSLPIGKVLQI